LPAWSMTALKRHWAYPLEVDHRANAIVGGRGWAASKGGCPADQIWQHPSFSQGTAWRRLANTAEGPVVQRMPFACRDYWVGPWGRGNNVNRRRKATRKSTVRVAKGGGKAARGRGRIALERCSVATYSRAISNICCWQPAVAAENNLRGCSPLAQSGKRLFLESTTTWHSKR
jgi:hypothetical protein